MLDALPVQWRVVRTIKSKYSCRIVTIQIVHAPAIIIRR